MDHIVIDIETKNTFADVGRDNFRDLEVSLVGLYSYNNDAYYGFLEHEIDKAGEMLKNAGLIIGFSINRFDIPVLAKHFDFDLFAIPNIDILDEIELLTGRRIGLDILARHNLGYGKTGTGLDAPILYKEGRIDELKEYCINDVKVTKDLYDLARTKQHLFVPQKDGSEPLRVDFDWQQKILFQRLF